MNYKELVVENYKNFCFKNGSEYIATEFALETILKIIKLFNVTSILELGLGIGSISDTVLKYSENSKIEIQYLGTENNQFCLNALKNNVEYYDKLNIYSELEDIPSSKFDLLIIDGYEKSIENVLNYCSKNAIIYIEGDRNIQLKSIIKMILKGKYVRIITLKRNREYSHGNNNNSSYMGGGSVILINPTFKMNLFWLEQKLLTFLKYKIRKINI